jgi:hypothetical protein
MITEEFTNKMDALFPNLVNADANGNTIASTELWKGVSEKYADSVAKVLAPVKDCILDVQTDLQIRNADACPVVQVEVIETMGDAMIDGTSWDKSDIKNKYVDVKLHRVSRPFKLSAYDIMRGERIESKIKAAMESVANGVVSLFMGAVGSAEPQSYTNDEFSPEKAVEIASKFDNGCETLILNPAYYSKLVPTNGLGLDPATDGVYGIGHIYKCGVMPSQWGVALEKNAVAGAVATPEIIFNKVGQGMQYLGEIGGIPMVLISTFDYDTQTIKCSVETLAGFTVTDTKKVLAYCI